MTGQSCTCCRARTNALSACPGRCVARTGDSCCRILHRGCCSRSERSRKSLSMSWGLHHPQLPSVHAIQGASCSRIGFRRSERASTAAAHTSLPEAGRLFSSSETGLVDGDIKRGVQYWQVNAHGAAPQRLHCIRGLGLDHHYVRSLVGYKSNPINTIEWHVF